MGKVYVNGETIVGMDSESYTDENNWYSNKFDGYGYTETICEDGIVKQRYLTSGEHGAAMGNAFKTILCRMQNIELPEENKKIAEELDKKWIVLL